MVARLKLKGIDGRAPPGVNIVSLRSRSNSAPKSSSKELGVVLVSTSSRTNLNASLFLTEEATSSNCGKLLKL
jgi:hypothetical protein